PRVSIIASRDSLCVHPKVSSQYSGTQLNQQCQLLSATRKCAFHNHVDEFEKGNPRLIDEVFDIEDMVMVSLHAFPLSYLGHSPIRRIADDHV
ncbi:hypothetical protein BVRB_029000, partial [Beta vulgaris subsp. vulgaris]